ncbi:REP-associated tyrosine transposase [Klebsiella variicola]|uniref:REP-associated tyrosine transposase n=1 Tax=Klebsiella variicola TaxID=244366 RepID=UPI003990C613
MSDYRRSYLPGGCWFFTVNLQNRHSDLLTRHIDHLRAATAFVKSKKPFLINSWVVLPEHMHCIWTLPEGDTDYSGRWHSALSGSRASGNMPSVMKKITGGIWITFISIPLSTVMSVGCRIGRIRPFIAMCAGEGIRRIGRVR